MTGGDDYEILCAVPDEGLESFLEATAAAGVDTAPIGVVEKGKGQPVFRSGNRERNYERGSFSHF